jgi:poly-gamma-glutamate synthesis protein (capsule biosynthesis protein)
MRTRSANWLYPVLLLAFLAPFAPATAQIKTDTLRLLFAGDVMGHAPQITSAQLVKDKKYDYEPCFQYVKPIVSEADLAIANLELTLPGKPPYTGYPMFRSPDALAEALKNTGFDVLVTANNHSNDARGSGVISTIRTLDRLKLSHTGTFASARERDTQYPLILSKNGFRLALLNYTYGTNGVPTDSPTIVNLIDKTRIAADLEKAKSLKPHYIIAFLHWGLEYQLTENAEQRDLAAFLARNGADLVIGAHPHVVQPVRQEQTSTPEEPDKSVVVVYSLGNYISNQLKPHTDGGIMFEVELLKKEGADKAETGRNGIIPVWRYIHREPTGKTAYFAVPIARAEADPALIPDMAPAAKAAMLQFAADLRKRIGYNEIRH